MHQYCLIDSNCLDLVVSACIQLLCFDDIEVSFTCKKVLLQLLKPKKKKSIKLPDNNQNKQISEINNENSLKQQQKHQQPIQKQIQVDEEISLPLEDLSLNNAELNNAFDVKFLSMPSFESFESLSVEVVMMVMAMK